MRKKKKIRLNKKSPNHRAVLSLSPRSLPTRTPLPCHKHHLSSQPCHNGFLPRHRPRRGRDVPRVRQGTRGPVVGAAPAGPPRRDARRHRGPALDDVLVLSQPQRGPGKCGGGMKGVARARWPSLLPFRKGLHRPAPSGQRPTSARGGGVGAARALLLEGKQPRRAPPWGASIQLRPTPRRR